RYSKRCKTRIDLDKDLVPRDGSFVARTVRFMTVHPYAAWRRRGLLRAPIAEPSMNRLAVSIALLAVAACCSADEIPFHDCPGMICVDLAVDGSKPRTLLFDTGNVNSSL